jgi:AcrR family transcriptional regulator
MSATPPPVPYATAARELLRNTLFDAARRELASRDWSGITMADIAATAGVSRQTLYNEFGSRAEFAQALAIREAGLFLDAVDETLSAHPGHPRGALKATFELFLTAAAENSIVRAIVVGEGAEELLAMFTTQGGTLVEQASTRLTELLRRSWPQIDGADAELLSDCIVRLAISHAALPKATPAQAAADVATLLGPYVDALIERATA